MKTLDFKGIFYFQILLFVSPPTPLQRWEYMDFTEKLLFLPQTQIGSSFWGPKAHDIKMSLNCLKCVWAASFSHLPQVNLHPFLAISAIEMFCSLLISNRSLNFFLQSSVPTPGIQPKICRFTIANFDSPPRHI
jgi:hypothetical protein